MAVVLLLAALVDATSAGAQTGPARPATPSAPALAPAQTPAPSPAPLAGAVPLTLSASFPSDMVIRAGLVWRVYADAADGAPVRLAAKTTVANPTLSLPPGPYVVHASYGLAATTRRVSLGPSGAVERFTIGAGGLRLAGAIGDVPIPANRISFSIFAPVGSDSEGRLVAGNVKSGELVRLPEGPYRIVSAYGESNAVMRTDLKIEPGRVVEATLNHRAATVTLKLVAPGGGEAFAGTAFSVLTPGGDVVREAIGAFPTVTLAEGDYVLIARHAGNVYTRDFKVESGLDRDIEVVAKGS